jgi:membrane protein DedA with SNARE-associated domain
VLAGYAAGASYRTIESRLGTSAALVVLGVVVLAVIGWRLRRRLAGRRPGGTRPR